MSPTPGAPDPAGGGPEDGPDPAGRGPEGTPDPTELVDRLPADLDVTAAGEGYRIPDNARRRIPGILYVVIGTAAVAARLASPQAVLINDGVAVAGAALVAFGAFHLVVGRRVRIDERAALVTAQRTVGFPVGHASAQMAWRGLLSRPVWRVLVYSAEDPPLHRGIVVVDAVGGRVVETFVEATPADGSEDRRPPRPG